MSGQESETLVVLCSTASGEASIAACSLDPATGRLTHRASTDVANPAFLAVSPDRERVYVANRTDGGLVSAFALAPDGSLRHLNDRSSEGESPCYVSVDAAGEYVFAANYRGGTVAAYPVADDGRPEPASDVVAHEGSGPIADRQEAPHPHSIGPAPGDGQVYAPDLGTDTVAVYDLERDTGSLDPSAPPGVSVAPGAGPRHFDATPDGRYVYVVNELDSTLSAFERNPATGALEGVDTVATLPADADGEENSPADVHVHPSGRWVYASNRGHDSIAVFEIGEGGAPRAIDHEPTRGEWPRDFELDPSGRILLALNRDSGTVEPFAVDRETGRLEPTGEGIDLAKPTCARAIERRYR